MILLGSLALSALFFAQGGTSLAAAWIFDEDAEDVQPARRARRAPTFAATKRWDATGILRKNIFDSAAGPLDQEPKEENANAGPQEEYDPNAPPPPCSGSTKLVGAMVSYHAPEWSYAAIASSAGTALLYRQGGNVDGQEIVAIQPSTVVMRPTSGRLCALAMFQDEEGVARQAPPPTPPPTPGGDTPLLPERPVRPGGIGAAELNEGITKNSDTSFTIQRGLVTRVLENQAEIMRTARIVPQEEGGRVVGVKLYGIRRNSLLGHLGMQNGDMLRTINGFDLTSPDSALEAYARLRSADHLSVALVRRGSPLNLEMNIQ